MYRGQYARAHQKCAQQRQRERGDRQQQGPATKAAAFFGDRLRMQQRRAGQPRHEAGVFHRIPEPPTAPAQFVICPPRTNRDTQGEEGPSRIRPRPRPTQPLCVDAALQQRGYGKCKRHRKAYIAGIQHRRVQDQAGVLQQGVEVAAFARRWQQARERVAGENQKRQKARSHNPHHAQYTRHDGLWQCAGKARHRRRPQRQHQGP